MSEDQLKALWAQLTNSLTSPFLLAHPSTHQPEPHAEGTGSTPCYEQHTLLRDGSPPSSRVPVCGSSSCSVGSVPHQVPAWCSADQGLNHPALRQLLSPDRSRSSALPVVEDPSPVPLQRYNCSPAARLWGWGFWICSESWVTTCPG